MIKLVFKAVKMDCPAEEQLIRLHFTGSPAVIQLQFDLPSRQLTVLHTGEVAPIAQALDGLKLGSSLVDSIPLEAKKYLVGRQYPVGSEKVPR